ncbi:MAG: ornithine carbamoyltransferase [Candidatus Omnitrophica bacterium]|nr:ornithine carbamoyltransferase [Candidatus Omnitrophota bacterium]
MKKPITKRDFVSLKSYTNAELAKLLDNAYRLKNAKNRITDDLKGKTIGLIFQKPSNRTRVSFEVGIHQLGGNCIYLGPEEINLGKRETTSDVAQTLSRYLDGIVARTFSHKDVVELAKFATVPVINGLTDLSHPCQAMADMLTIREHLGALKGIQLTYIGDGNNVCHSLMIISAKLGVNITIAYPKGYAPLDIVVKAAQELALETGTKITLTTNPIEAIKKANVIYADTWVSMGQEKEAKKRLKIFNDYQINKKMVAYADKNYVFMHCLPAHRGQEVTEEIIDGSHSVIFDQAENRLHAQKAILLYLLGKENIK